MLCSKAAAVTDCTSAKGVMHRDVASTGQLQNRRNYRVPPPSLQQLPKAVLHLDMVLEPRASVCFRHVLRLSTWHWLRLQHILRLRQLGYDELLRFSAKGTCFYICRTGRSRWSGRRRQ